MVPEVDGGRSGGRNGMGFQPGSGIVTREDGVDRFALARLDDGARLTQPDTVAEPLTREQNPVGLLFHAEACAAERARTELPADDGPQALASHHQVVLASHADTGCPARGVTADDRDLVETLPDRGFRGGVEDSPQMIAVEAQAPVVARGHHAETVADTGEIRRGRAAPDGGGRTGVATTISMEQRLNRAVPVADDQPAGLVDGGGNEAGNRGRLLIGRFVDLAVRGRTEVEPVVRVATSVGECVGPGEDRLETGEPVGNGGVRFGERHLGRDRPADVVLEPYRPNVAIAGIGDLDPQRLRVSRWWPRRLRRGPSRGGATCRAGGDRQDEQRLGPRPRLGLPQE